MKKVIWLLTMLLIISGCEALKNTGTKTETDVLINNLGGDKCYLAVIVIENKNEYEASYKITETIPCDNANVRANSHLQQAHTIRSAQKERMK